MSALFDSVGAAMIAAGAFKMWRDSRILAIPPYRRRDPSRAERTARRKALSSLLWSLFFVVLGVYWIAGWYTHVIVAGLVGAVLVASVVYDVTVWRRSRKRRGCAASPSGS